MKTLVILTNFDFDNPSGAAWGRVLNYAKALAEVKTETILTSSLYSYSEKLKKNKITKDIYYIKGLPIDYKTTFEDFHFKRYLSFITHIHRGLSDIKDKKYLLYNANLASATISLLFLRSARKQKIFIEKNELRTAIAMNLMFKHDSLIQSFFDYPYKLLRILSGIVTDFLALFFSGIVVISTRFENLYTKFKRTVLRIPILIDKNDIPLNTHRPQRKNSNKFRIGYFGWIGEKKDGIFSLISVINKLSATTPIELHLYGTTTKKMRNKLDLYIDNKAIYFNGNIPKTNVMDESSEYDLLALVRPRNLQTMYGFSTKLGDYLLSGVPVLVTNVSDNEMYLKDQENAFIVRVKSKIDHQKLETKILQIYTTDKEKLDIIGSKGKETAVIHFNYKEYVTSINDFFFTKHK